MASAGSQAADAGDAGAADSNSVGGDVCSAGSLLFDGEGGVTCGAGVQHKRRAQAHYTRDLEDAAGGANRELRGVAEELVPPVSMKGQFCGLSGLKS